MSGRFEDRLKVLGALPALDPPPHLESATLAAMADAASASHRGPRQLARAAVWIAAFGVGALLAVFALDFERGATGPAADPAAAGTASPEATADQAYASADEIYWLLAAQSEWLEQVLAAIPEQRRVIRVGTAATAVGLENGLARIDAELARAASEAVPPEYRTLLMRDRVEVMNALVNVRYAQSRAFSF